LGVWGGNPSFVFFSADILHHTQREAFYGLAGWAGGTEEGLLAFLLGDDGAKHHGFNQTPGWRCLLLFLLSATLGGG
jgi:hypothetical protein